MREWTFALSLWGVAIVVSVLAWISVEPPRAAQHESTAPGRSPPTELDVAQADAEPTRPSPPHVTTRNRAQIGPDQLSSDAEAVPAPEPDPPPVLSLRVTLRDSGTQAPLTTRVDLWQLKILETPEWRAGDHRHERTWTQGGEVRFEGLGPGRYRLYLPEARGAADDPPEIELVATNEHLVADVDMPRVLPIRLIVFDEDLRPLTDGVLSVLGSGSMTRSSRPKWATQRRSRTGVRQPGSGGWTACNPGDDERYPIIAGTQGFELGVVNENSQQITRSRAFTFAATDSNSIGVHARGDGHAVASYVAPSATLEWLAAPITLPDGTPAFDAGATITATCRAEALREATARLLVQDIEMEVLVELDGYESLKIERRMSERAPEPVTLRVAVKTGQ